MSLPLFRWYRRISLQVVVSLLGAFAVLALAYHTNLGRDLVYEKAVPLPSPSPEAREGVVPKPCVAYKPDVAGWGYETGLCPANHAFMANHDIGGANKSGPGEYVRIQGLCCPLPAADILTARHSYAEFESCPDQHVATGGAGECEEGCSMRCTQINTQRYKLGPERQSMYAAFPGWERRFGAGSAKRVRWSSLPESIRYAVARSSHNTWKDDGCVGAPLGSMLTRKSGKRCDGFFYRELLYLDGTPVQILPDCPVLSDPYAPNPRCLAPEDKHLAVEAIVIHD